MALRGIKVIELAGLAPGPFCGMVLSDFGASIIRIDKAGPVMDIDCLANGKQSLALNLKHKKGIEIFKKLSKTSDVILDTYRAGVMETLGLGPNVLLHDNPRLVYARLSGYGQYGPFAQKAGHDINYASLTGVLSMLKRSNQTPFPPINIFADFGGGGLMCALGIVLALLERVSSGKGQIVDCNMVEGAAYLASWLCRSQTLPFWGNETGKNVLDGGAGYYNVYETKDGKYMAVGALEPKFYSELVKGLGILEENYPQTENNTDIFKELFLKKTQEEWNETFSNLDACVTPVLSLTEAPKHPHNIARNSFVPASDCEQLIPGPAPRLSRTPGVSQAMKPKLKIGEHSELILKQFNYSGKEIFEMENEGIIAIHKNSKM